MARIEHYEFGRIVVDGREEQRDLIILPDRVVRNWWRRDGHALVLEDLQEVLDELPERLLIGTGAYGRMRPDQGMVERLTARGVTVESLETGQAIRRYGELEPARTGQGLPRALPARLPRTPSSWRSDRYGDRGDGLSWDRQVRHCQPRPLGLQPQHPRRGADEEEPFHS